MSVVIKPKPYMKNPSEVKETYGYANEGEYILYIIQISVTITDTVAHNYNKKFIEISVDHLHIYKVFMA